MQRVDGAEILDSDACPPEEVETSVRDLDRVNRWFGGVATTRALIERIAKSSGRAQFSWLDVASGSGEVPRIVARQLSRRGIKLEIALLDRAGTHLAGARRALVGDALALPFADDSFDLVGCNLFAHHLAPENLQRFAKEAMRVCRCAVLINDLVRHPLHVALVYAGFPLMRSHVSRVDGVTSVKRAYVPEEMRRMISDAVGDSPVEITRHYLFRMGVIAWKGDGGAACRNPDPSLRSG